MGEEKFEFFALREKRGKGETLSLEEATLLQIGEFLEKRKNEMKVEKKRKKKIEKEKEKEIPEKKRKN
jgi:hypothetical protein